MTRGRIDSRPAGFTLLEVLVALVILAVALVALTRTAGLQTRHFDEVRQRALAGWVASNALAEVRLRPGIPEIGRSDGRARMAGRDWPWQLEVEATPARGIRHLRVSVYAPGTSPDNAAPLTVLDGFADDMLLP